MKKFELVTDSAIDHHGVTLFRIRALMDFSNVKAGDIGGYVMMEENLSHEGNAWVRGDAKVFGDALVSGDARVHGEAHVYDGARVYGNAEVYGDARVGGNALVSGNAQVYGNAEVYGDARVGGNALVSGDAEVFGNARVGGNARVSGNAVVTSECTQDCVSLSGLRYNLTVTDNRLRAGCQEYTFDEWRKFTADEISRMDGKRAIEFYPHMVAIMEAVLALREQEK
jgi:carbonic anhydrase/acetyltransferase-like protein (isoleucine patch superfamily)